MIWPDEPDCGAKITVEVPCGSGTFDEPIYADCMMTLYCTYKKGHKGNHHASAPTDQPASLEWITQ